MGAKDTMRAIKAKLDRESVSPEAADQQQASLAARVDAKHVRNHVAEATRTGRRLRSVD